MESQIENFNGNDASGNSGDKNRTLTISNTSETDNNNFQVFANNSFLHLNIDYTVAHNESESVVTFLINLWDDQNITVIYEIILQTLKETTGDKGVLPLDTQLINNEINYFGNSITIRANTKLDEDNRGNSQMVWGDSKISYTSGDDALSSFYNANWIAQTFTTSTLINTTSIKLKVKRTGTPGAITIGIRAVDGDNKPTGSDLTSGSLDYTDLIDDAETEWIVLPLTDYTLSANTTYAIIIREASGDTDNKYESRIKTTGTYSGGNNLTSSDSGSSWTVGSADILFDLYGDTETVAMVDILKMDDILITSGQFQSGDLRLNFQNAESNISRGTKVKYKNKWYQIDEVIIDSIGDVDYFSEAIARKI